MEIVPGFGPGVKVFMVEKCDIRLSGAIRVAVDDNPYEKSENRKTLGKELYTLLKAIIKLPGIHSVYLANEHGTLCFAVWRSIGKTWDGESELEGKIQDNISSALKGLNASNGP